MKRKPEYYRDALIIHLFLLGLTAMEIAKLKLSDIGQTTIWRPKLAEGYTYTPKYYIVISEQILPHIDAYMKLLRKQHEDSPLLRSIGGKGKLTNMPLTLDEVCMILETGGAYRTTENG